MGAMEILQKERKNLELEKARHCASLDARIAEIDAAINAIKSVRERSKAKACEPSRERSHKMSIDEAVIESVNSGNRQPAAILKYMEQHLGVHTTINSVRTRLSKLKNAGRVARDDRGWIMPNEKVDDLHDLLS